MKIFYLMLCLVFLFLLTGCWDLNESNRITIVLGTGIDQLDNGEYEITVQIVKPSEKGTKNNLVLTNRGKTVGEAVERFVTNTPRHMFWGQNKMLIFGESISKNGIKDIIDWFERYREFRFPYVFTASGKAKEIISTKLPLEQLSAMGMEHIISYRYRHLSRITPTLNQFSEHFFEHSKVGYATHLGSKKNTKDKQLQILGLGLFKDGKNFAYLTNEQVIDFILFLPENLKGGTILIPCSNNPQKYTTFEFDHKKTKIYPVMINNKLVYNISVENDGSIASTNCGEKINTPEQMEKLEKKLNEIIKKRMTNLLDLAQKKYKIDFLRFDKELQQHDLSYWREVEHQWEDIFPTIEVKIHVDNHIRRINGATNDPIPEDN